MEDVHGGIVPVDKVVGRAIVVAWPLNRWATLPVPDTFDQPGINAAAAARLGGAPVALGVARRAADRALAQEEADRRAYRRVGCRPRSPIPGLTPGTESPRWGALG